MRVMIPVFLLFLLVSGASALSPAGPEPSLQLQVSEGSEAVNLILVNNREVEASNISLDVDFEGKSERSFELDNLDGESNFTFNVSEESLGNLSLKNVSRVTWNISGSWEENFSAVFNILSGDEETTSSYRETVKKQDSSPVTFNFPKDDLVIFEDSLSRKIFLRYRPYDSSKIFDLNISIQGPDGVNISKVDEKEYRRENIYSVEFSRPFLERDELKMNFSAEYRTLNQGEEFDIGPDREASVFDVLTEFFSLFVWTFSFSVELVISALDLIF